MGEKPNEQDEMGREPAAGGEAEKAGPRDTGSGQESARREAPPAGGGMTRESPTRGSMGRPSAALADVDRDGMADERRGPAAGGGGGPEEATNLNSSKSNIERAAGSGGGEGPGDPAESINLNSSRSNIERKMPEGGKDAEQRSDHVYQHNQTDLEFTGRE